MGDPVEVLADWEVLKTLFLDTSLQQLFVACNFSWPSLNLLRRRGAAIASLWWRCAILALRRLSWRTTLTLC